MSSFKLSPAPLNIEPVVKEGTRVGFFAPAWEIWFRDVWNLLRIITATIPSSVGWSGTYAGGGTAFSISMDIVVQSQAVIYVTGTWLQQFAVAQPDWQVQLTVDGTAIFDSATVVGTWEQCISGSSQVTVTPGTHTVALIWMNANANGTLTRANLVAFPELAS